MISGSTEKVELELEMNVSELALLALEAAVEVVGSEIGEMLEVVTPPSDVVNIVEIAFETTESEAVCVLV